jgi:hypothetical protein
VLCIRISMIAALVANLSGFAVGAAKAEDARPPKVTMGGPPEVYRTDSAPLTRGLRPQGAPTQGGSVDPSITKKPCDKAAGCAIPGVSGGKD